VRTGELGELETPVFLGARRRVTWLRGAGVAAGALVVLWLVALVAGVLGFGSVAGLSLPGLDAAKTPVLHRAAGRVTAGPGGLRTSPGLRQMSSTSISLRARGTPSRDRGRSRGFAGRRARGHGRASAPHRRSVGRSRTSAPGSRGRSVAVPPARAVHGRHLGKGGSGTSSPPTSNSHRAGAPGQQRTKPTASAPASPNARRNRLTTAR
jgi:hypothetical protein